MQKLIFFWSFLFSFHTIAYTIDFTSQDLAMQEGQFPLALFGHDAFEMALESVLNDETTSESPLLIVGSKDALLDILASPRSTFFLVNKNDEDHRPQWGESVDRNWIFCLYLPEVSDHLYWIVIDRMNVALPYVYGFN